MKEKQSNSKVLLSLLERLPDFCDSFLIGRKNEREITTRINYAWDLIHFFDFLRDTHPFFCDKEIKQIQATDMQQVSVADMDKFIEIYSDDHSQRTIARMKSSVSALYGFLSNTLGAVQNNPMLGAQKVKIPEKDFVVYLNREEQERMLNTIKFGNGLTGRTLALHDRYVKRDLAMVFLFLDTGLRVSEMNGIDNSDFDLHECSVIVRRKGGKISKVYFSDESAEYIRDYMEEKEVLLPMFCGRDYPFLITEKGNRLSVRQIEEIVPKYVSAALPEKKDHISPHKLRSSFALSFYMRPVEAGGRDILALQRRMNHKSLQATNIYAKAADNVSKETRNWRQ